MGLEFGMRKLFTDYLDDVSTTYVDQAVLLANRGQKLWNLHIAVTSLKTEAPYPAARNFDGAAQKRKTGIILPGLRFLSGLEEIREVARQAR